MMFSSLTWPVTRRNMIGQSVSTKGKQRTLVLKLVTLGAHLVEFAQKLVILLADGLEGVVEAGDGVV